MEMTLAEISDLIERLSKEHLAVQNQKASALQAKNRSEFMRLSVLEERIEDQIAQAAADKVRFQIAEKERERRSVLDKLKEIELELQQSAARWNRGKTHEEALRAKHAEIQLDFSHQQAHADSLRREINALSRRLSASPSKEEEYASNVY